MSRFINLIVAPGLSAAALMWLMQGQVSTPSAAVNTRSRISQPNPTAERAEVAPASFRSTHRKDSRFARPIEVSERQFGRLSSQGLVLIKFGADWCGPCRRVVPELESVARENADSLKVLTIDVDKEKRLAGRYDVGSIPRMILLFDGTKVDDWTGYSSAVGIQKRIDRAKKSMRKGDVQANPFAA